MKKIQIIDKSTQQAFENETNQVSLSNPSTVYLNMQRNEVKQIYLKGNDLVILLKNGETIIIQNYFVNHATSSSNEIIVREQDQSTHPLIFDKKNLTEIQNLDEIESDQNISTFSKWAWGTVGVLAVGGLAVVATATHGISKGIDSIIKGTDEPKTTQPTTVAVTSTTKEQSQTDKAQLKTSELKSDSIQSESHAIESTTQVKNETQTSSENIESLLNDKSKSTEINLDTILDKFENALITAKNQSDAKQSNANSNPVIAEKVTDLAQKTESEAIHHNTDFSNTAQNQWIDQISQPNQFV